jgi:hypothetical protein
MYDGSGDRGQSQKTFPEIVDTGIPMQTMHDQTALSLDFSETVIDGLC